MPQLPSKFNNLNNYYELKDYLSSLITVCASAQIGELKLESRMQQSDETSHDFALAKGALAREAHPHDPALATRRAHIRFIIGLRNKRLSGDLRAKALEFSSVKAAEDYAAQLSYFDIQIDEGECLDNDFESENRKSRSQTKSVRSVDILSHDRSCSPLARNSSQHPSPKPDRSRETANFDKAADQLSSTSQSIQQATAVLLRVAYQVTRPVTTTPESQPTQPGFSRRFAGLCFNCGTPGHLARNCCRPRSDRRQNQENRRFDESTPQ